jgi:hypothetical protein
VSEEQNAEPPLPSEGEVAEGQQPPTPSELGEMAKLERRLKITTVVVAILALIASASSAAAAWASWRTANASEQVAREAARTSGAYLKLSTMVGLFGACGDIADPLVAVVSVENQGHIAGRVRSLTLDVDIQDRSVLPTAMNDRLAEVNVPAPSPGGASWITVAATSGVVVPPQDSVDVRMPVDCESLYSLTIDPAQAIDQLRVAIRGRLIPWVLTPDFTFGENEPALPTGVYGNNYSEWGPPQ